MKHFDLRFGFVGRGLAHAAMFHMKKQKCTVLRAPLRVVGARIARPEEPKTGTACVSSKRFADLQRVRATNGRPYALFVSAYQMSKIL